MAKNPEQQQKRTTSPKEEVHMKYFISRNVARETSLVAHAHTRKGEEAGAGVQGQFTRHETLSEKINRTKETKPREKSLCPRHYRNRLVSRQALCFSFS